MIVLGQTRYALFFVGQFGYAPYTSLLMFTAIYIQYYSTDGKIFNAFSTLFSTSDIILFVVKSLYSINRAYHIYKFLLKSFRTLLTVYKHQFKDLYATYELQSNILTLYCTYHTFLRLTSKSRRFIEISIK